ncbi:MAG: M28 family peptidase [Symbiobacterium sp.]|uniref:M28 family peptidase n=1 Tax=Symbiobacterium sp. TaxID=1971213 RepID=UPI0034638978
MNSAWTYLERLTRYPHRAVGSREEAAAAEEAAGWLRDMGYDVEVQRFRAPRDTLYIGPAVIMAGYLGAAAIAYWWQPWVGLVFALLLLIPLAGEMSGKGLDLDAYTPRVNSQNVIARAPEGEGQRLTVVVSGHLDTQHATWLFHPRFARHVQTYLNVAYGSLGVMLVGLLLQALLPGARLTAVLLAVGAVLLALHIAFLLACAFSGGYINGANDNTTGAALTLALAEYFAAHPLPGVRFHFVLTGAEEVGTRGMKAFLRQYRYDPSTTYFINLDNLGGGTLTYLEGEGMTLYHRFGADLVDLARRMAEEHAGKVKAKPNLLLPTDAMIPAAQGYQAISFLAFLPDGSLPNYHWYSDTIEHVDKDLVSFTEEFLKEYIRRLAAQRGAA